MFTPVTKPRVPIKMEHYEVSRDRYVRDIYTKFEQEQGHCEVNLNTMYFMEKGQPEVMCDVLSKHIVNALEGLYLGELHAYEVKTTNHGIFCILPEGTAAEQMCHSHDLSESLVEKMNEFASNKTSIIIHPLN